MKPKDIQTINDELAIVWEDGHESYYKFEFLRRSCPCAACAGERDVLGKVYKAAPKTYAAQSFELAALTPVGSYAIQPVWKDGHGSGIYAWDYLRQICPCEECKKL